MSADELDVRSARLVQRAYASSRRLAAASSLLAAEAIVIDAVIDLVDADRASCLYFDGDSGALWSEARQHAGGDDRRADRGLAGQAARSGQAVAVARAAAAPGWAAELDDPDGDARLLVQPVVDASGDAQAVIVAARSGRRGEFSPADAAVLARFAAMAAPLLAQIADQAAAQEVIDAQTERGLFRREAIAARTPPRWGDVVRVTPPWLPAVSRALVVVVALGVALLAFGRVSTHAVGPVLVRALARADVVASSAGTVTAVEVAPGAAIAAGEVVATLDDGAQRATRDRLQREHDAQLRAHLLDPGDRGAEAAVRALSAELATAQAALDDRVVRAGFAGTVGDVRIRTGQRLAAGDVVASVATADEGLEAIAFLPGADRPQLVPGMTLQVRFDGFRDAVQSAVIEHIAEDVIGPGEARRLLGPDVADGLRLAGPVVVVHARLRVQHVHRDGRRYALHDGMVGEASVRLRSQRIIAALLPLSGDR